MFLEAIDASGTELMFEAFDNMINLSHLRLLRLANCPHIDDWLVVITFTVLLNFVVIKVVCVVFWYVQNKYPFAEFFSLLNIIYCRRWKWIKTGEYGITVKNPMSALASHFFLIPLTLMKQRFLVHFIGVCRNSPNSKSRSKCWTSVAAPKSRIAVWRPSGSSGLGFLKIDKYLMFIFLF